jgi:predicted XRE-type DNA-binding protein
MKDTKLDVVRGSGNVFRDLGHKNPDAEQFKAILATEIIRVLDRDGLSVRAAHDRTGIAAADFSRIRNADLGRFTLDRLMLILGRLGSRVVVKVKVCRAESLGRARTGTGNGARTPRHGIKRGEPGRSLSPNPRQTGHELVTAQPAS